MAVEMSGEILEVLIYLQDIFGDQYAPARVKAYVVALADINIIQLRAGASKLARSSRFLPRLAEIRSAAQACEIMPIEPLIRRREGLRYQSWCEGGYDGSAWDELYERCWSAGYWDLARYVEQVKSRCEKVSAEVEPV